MREQFGCRTGVASQSTKRVHQQWQYKLTALIYFLSLETKILKKAIKLTKNFAQHMLPVLWHQPRGLETHRPWELLFSTQGSHPRPLLSMEEAGAVCVRGERRLAKLPYLFMGLP